MLALGLAHVYERVMPRRAGGLTLKLHYGIRTAYWAKTEVTMRFLVENYPQEVVSWSCERCARIVGLSVVLRSGAELS